MTTAGLPVWLATGAALTALALLGLSYWPVVLAAGWLSAIAMGYPPLLAAPFALTGLMEALAGMAILRFSERFSGRLPQKLRGLHKLIPTVVITLMVPAVGATLIAAGHPLAGFSIAWKSWWIRDAAGLLLLAPLWTLLPREATTDHPVKQRTAEHLLTYDPSGLEGLRKALAAFETSAPVIVTENQETTVHRPE
jgi:integral membrane sensor domain MASE1